MGQLVAGQNAETKLIEHARAGRDDAFEEIVRRHQRLIRCFVASRIADRHAADEVSQNVFVAAYQGLNGYAQSGTLAAWLLGIARNQVLTYLRQRMSLRERTVSVEAAMDAAEFGALDRESPDPDEEMRRLESLRTCLQSLDDRQQDLVHRYYFQGEPAEQIAAALNRPASTVRMTLLRIRRLLHACILRNL